LVESDVFTEEEMLADSHAVVESGQVLRFVAIHVGTDAAVTATLACHFRLAVGDEKYEILRLGVTHWFQITS
jgi:hypothetical protein